MEIKASEATQVGGDPGPDAQVIGALDEGKSDSSSESFKVEITGASEHTSDLSMKERLEKEKRDTTSVKVEPREVDLDDPLNKPLKAIFLASPSPWMFPLRLRSSPLRQGRIPRVSALGRNHPGRSQRNTRNDRRPRSTRTSLSHVLIFVDCVNRLLAPDFGAFL